MKFLLKLLLFAFCCIFFFACTSEYSKPNPTGKAGEIAIVLDQKLKETLEVKKLKNILSEPVYGLPQSEPSFDISIIPSDIFGPMFKMLRNLVILNVNPDLKSESINFLRDIWANNQAVVRIDAKNSESLNAYLQLNEEKIFHFFLSEESRRSSEFYNQNFNPILKDTIYKKLGISISLPKGYTLLSNRNNFLWFGQEIGTIQQGFFVYQIPLNNLNTLSKEYLLQKRDSVLKDNVPGGPKDSYMTTEHEYPAYSSEKIINKKSSLSVVGLWKIQGDIMGGPFTLVAVPDPKNNRIIILDGYVYYAEKAKKRNYIRQIEAIFETAKIRS